MMHNVKHVKPKKYEKIIAITKHRGVKVGIYMDYKNPTIDTVEGAFHFTHWISESDFVKGYEQ